MIAASLSLSRDGDVLEAGLEQPQDLVAPAVRLHGECAGADALEHGVAVRAQPKEVIALFGGDQVQGGVLEAVAVDDLGPGLELFAPGAVQPLVLRLEQVVGPVPPDALQERPNGARVPRLGGADPVVVAAVEPAPVAHEGIGHAVDPRLRRHLCAGGGVDHGLAVLVHSHQEVHVVAAQAAVAGDAVRADLLERVAEVRLAVRVVDRGREVELGRQLTARSARPSPGTSLRVA